MKVQAGDNGTGTTLSRVDTQYAPCACSPLGKMSQVSSPYKPGEAVVWTLYQYDASGRTTRVTAPDGVSATAYAYQGNQTTVTDAAGKWKKYTTDAMGNLSQVTEPDPVGGANLIAAYSYDALNHMTQVGMPRQQDAKGQVTDTPLDHRRCFPNHWAADTHGDKSEGQPQKPGRPQRTHYRLYTQSVGTPNRKLSVNGTIPAKEVTVKTNWSDYVFQPA